MVAFFFPPPSFVELITLTDIFYDEASGDSVSLVGSGLLPGDLIVFMQVTSSEIWGPSVGYTIAKQTSSSLDGGGQCGFKIASGAETDVTPGTLAATIGTAVRVYRPSRAITSISYGTWNSQVTTNNPSQQTVNPTALSPPVLVLAGAYGADTNFNFSVQTPPFDADPGQQLGGSHGMRTGWSIRSTSPPATQLIDMSDLGEVNVLISGYIAVS